MSERLSLNTRSAPASSAQELWQQRLQAIEPAVLLISAKLLRRIARVSQAISVLARRVPHEDVYVLPRDSLLDLATERELGISSGSVLPERVILIAWPGPIFQGAGLQGILLRRLVHGWIHLYSKAHANSSSESVTQERIRQLGAAEWEEICAVASQEKWLPRHEEPDYVIYQEFAAHWWQLRLVGPTLLPIWFPGLAWQAERVDAILMQDVDIELLKRKLRSAEWIHTAVAAEKPNENTPDDHPSKPSGANPQSYEVAQSTVPAKPTLEPSSDLPLAWPQELAAVRDNPEWQAIEAVARRGNLVGALRRCWWNGMRQSGPMRVWWQEQARQFLSELAQRLARALPPEGETHQEHLTERQTWEKALWPLVPTAAQGGYFSQEARLLYDLQRLSEDASRGVYVVDLAGWLRTLGKLAWRRQQPFLQQFLILRRLRCAHHRVALCQLEEAARLQLEGLLDSAISHQEHYLRQQVLPVVRQVLEEVGLVPRNVAERIEQERLVQELADRIVETGHLNLGQLRDAISRNQLKLPDLRGVRQWWQGDPLLAANRRLAWKLDGVYRPGEVYLRWFQRFSSLFFGTWLGRLLSLFVILPFGGAYILLEGFDHAVIHPLAHWFGLDFHVSGPYQTITLGLFLVGVINFPEFRQVVRRWCRQAFIGLRFLLWELPKHIIRWPPLWRLWNSPPMLLFRRYLALPLFVGVLTYFTCALSGVRPPVFQLVVGMVTLFSLLVTLTREGHIFLATGGDYLAWTFRYLSLEWITLGLYWIIAFFQRLLNYVEQLQYRIDEWLRYRGGESRWQLFWKAVASLLWAWIAYLLRFSVYLLIEPQINPIKHFPVVTVSHKLLLAGLPVFTAFTLNLLGWEPTDVNKAKAAALVTSIIWAIPGIFGFLAWELKENWKLYDANRARTLRPLRIGNHGETLPQLLRPGVHSGTLRKVYQKGRRLFTDSPEALSAVQWTRWQQQLDHVGEAVHHFVERNLLTPLRLVPSWNGPIPKLAEIRLGITALDIYLTITTDGTKSTPAPEPAVLRFSYQGGWIVAQWQRPGWLTFLAPDLIPVLEHALRGFYHWGGVEIVAEELRRILPPGYDAQLDWEGLRLYRRDAPGQQAFYPWQETGLLTPQDSSENSWPSFSAQDLWFSAQALSWEEWQQQWQSPQLSVQLMPSLDEEPRIQSVSPAK